MQACQRRQFSLPPKHCVALDCNSEATCDFDEVNDLLGQGPEAKEAHKHPQEIDAHGNRHKVVSAIVGSFSSRT